MGVSVSQNQFRKIIRWSRLLTEPHQKLIGTIPFDPADDARWRGRHFRSERAEKTPATDPLGHTPTKDYLTSLRGGRHHAKSMADPWRLKRLVSASGSAPDGSLTPG